VSVAGETGRHDAAQYICDNHKLGARYGIVGLGTGNRVCLGNKGRLDIEIIVRGQACHSSTPWEGIDAVRGAREVMERLDRLSLDIAHPDLGRATLTTTKVESGPAASHTLQDTCRLVLDRRLLPGEDPEKAFEAIAKSISDLPPWRIELSRGAFMYPSQVSRDSLIAECLDAACRLMGSSTEPFYAHASLDAGYLNRVGIETVMFGPGDLRFAHTDKEVVSLQEVREAARIYAAAALQLLA
jgi:acetylornithine deacetylase